MPWYFCNCEAPGRPLLYTTPLDHHNCVRCRQPTTLANNHVRYTSPDNNYTVKWYETGDVLILAVELRARSKNYKLLLSKEVVDTDDPIDADTALKPPTGGLWTGAMRTYSGGRRQNSAHHTVPSKGIMKLGRHTTGASYGLVHIFFNHPEMFGTMTASPAAGDVSLDNLAINLQSITGQPGRGVGVRKIDGQQNGRISVHGINSTTHSHAMVIIDTTNTIITTYGAQKKGGQGQMPITLVDYR